MNILTHAVHTGYQYDLAKTGQTFYSIDIPGSQEVFWDGKSRPQPKNFRRLKFSENLPVKMDIALVHFEFGYHCLKHSNLPLIFKEHCLREPFKVPHDWMDRIACYSFASNAAAACWQLPKEFAQRKVVIGMGMDVETYEGYEGCKCDVLVVGQNIRFRGNEKGYDNLIQLAKHLPICVVGMGNEGIPGAVGRAGGYNELLNHYREHRVFLNPSNTLNMATLEAMATGMPVVTFRMINSDVISHGVNGFVVDSVSEAEALLLKLLKNPMLAREVGKNGRALVRERFRTDLFVKRWNALFQKVVDEHASSCTWDGWHNFGISSKPDRERYLAEFVIHTSFEYHRVGFDKREMTFLPNGRVGKGAGGCELFWDVKVEGEESILEIFSGHDLTCRLKREKDENWTGRWLQFERMPVVLTPLSLKGRRQCVICRSNFSDIPIRSESLFQQ